MDCQVSEIRLKYRPKPISEIIKGSTDLHRFLIDKIYDEDTIGYKESFKVILFNQSNRIIGYFTASDGGLTSTIVDVRVVLQTALVTNATSMVLSHNHPSGNANPSLQDDNITKKIRSACELMEIRLLDHIIVTPFGHFYSYCDEGKI